ncbi:MAG: hypothetical protein KC613_10930 [Myxococcales bacterium]|nr:hypothetical protein [Myxococcales bacterium]MCB9525718.1 hypothetical protein [Myxococcales bacterium]
MRLLLALSAAALMALASPAQAIEKIPPEAKAVEIITQFLNAARIEDEGKRLQAVLPLLHKSMKSADGKDLPPNVKRYSYKKACDGAKFYQVPAKIFEVHKGNTVTVGFKETAEKGRTDKYFVEKKAGIAGRPAPLHVFFPADGGAPTLINIGSL